MSGNTQVLKKPLSRVGRRPVLIPKGVEVQIKDAQMTVKGPKGSAVVPIHPEVHVTLADNSVTVSPLSDDHKHRALHGLTRSLINNAVIGVTQGYRKSVEVRGVGYRAQQSGKGVTLAVGYSHPVEMQPPDGVAITVEGTNFIHISGADKQKVGEMAARIRAVRSPSPYMEKGLRYVGETPRTKPGKRAASAGGQQ
jgi:large subunit ribosomal protein L6